MLRSECSFWGNVFFFYLKRIKTLCFSTSSVHFSWNRSTFISRWVFTKKEKKEKKKKMLAEACFFQESRVGFRAEQASVPYSLQSSTQQINYHFLMKYSSSLSFFSQWKAFGSSCRQIVCSFIHSQEWQDKKKKKK